MLKPLLAATAVLGSMNMANAEGTVICGFVLNKTGQQVGYNLTVEPGNSRAVEVAFYKANEEIRHTNGGNPFWYISKSPNGGRNYTYGPDPRYVISVAPGQPELISLQAGQVKSWNAGLFVNSKRASRDGGFCMVPVTVAAPSMPPAPEMPTMPEQLPSMPQHPSENTTADVSGDLGAAFDANQ
jgi:hypothetical protein